jgi:hypothetical protein
MPLLRPLNRACRGVAAPGRGRVSALSPAAVRLRVLLLALVAAPAAQAERSFNPSGGYVLPGGYIGYGYAGGGALSYGGELSVMAWSRRDPLAGLWGQLGRVTGPHPHLRGALGGELMVLDWVGLELGVARLWLDDERRGHTLAAAPFITVGLASLSLRMGIPLDTTSRDVGGGAGAGADLQDPGSLWQPGAPAHDAQRSPFPHGRRAGDALRLGLRPESGEGYVQALQGDTTLFRGA